MAPNEDALIRTAPGVRPETETAGVGEEHAARLTAIILTLNEEEHIEACLRTLTWADEILVFDSFSQDDTVSLAKTAGATVLQSHFVNYAQQRNAALDAIETDWVFFVDADERATPQLATEIRQLIAQARYDAWFVPRHNYIFGKLTTRAGWYPDYQLRLLRHGRVAYERPVHEIAVVQGETGYLRSPLIHHNYRDKAQFRATQESYTRYDARILYEQGQRVRPHHYVLQPWRQFWWRFVALKGYADGWHGLWLSANMAYYEGLKQLRLARLWREAGPGAPAAG